MQENHFYKNRKLPVGNLYFKHWLTHAYFPRIHSFADTTVNSKIVTAAYNEEFNAARIYAEQKFDRKALEKFKHAESKYKNVNKQKIFTEIFTEEKRMRQKNEQQRNKEIIKNNIENIIHRCTEALAGMCTNKEKIVYKAVHTILTRINIDDVNPNDPMASGVLDLTMLGDTYMKELPEDVLELLTVSNLLKEVELPPRAQELLDEFEKTYKDLGTDFCLSDMDGIGYPVGIEDRQLKKNMGMIWGVLEGLRNIWTCTPRLDESDYIYSENALVVEAVSRILIPIFGSCSMPLTRAWGDRTSESSKHQKVQMGAVASANKPDLCILIDFEGFDVELAFCEFSSLEMGHPKHRDDWRKSVRSCKDGSDMLCDICFEGKKTDCNEASILIRSLNNIPSIAILNKGANLTVSVIDTFNGKFFKAFEILDINLPLRPVNRQEVEDLLKKALQLKTFVDDVACGVKRVLEESMVLPVDENEEEDIATRMENLTITSTPFTPHRGH